MIEFVIFASCLIGCSWVSYLIGWGQCIVKVNNILAQAAIDATNKNNLENNQ
jgi:hypothetical protein